MMRDSGESITAPLEDIVETEFKIIRVGDKILYGVFYGEVLGFNRSRTKVTVDFSNGAREPNLVFPVNTVEVKKVLPEPEHETHYPEGGTGDMILKEAV
jgi:hypothetical protein